MAGFDADEYRKGGWRTAVEKDLTHYQRLGLSAAGHVTSAEIVLAHQARANWWRQRGAQAQSGKNNPLIAEIAPFMKTAEDNLSLAVAVLRDVDQKSAYDRQIAELGAKANEAKLIDFIGFTLRDRILTPSERSDLLAQAQELGISPQRAEEMIRQEMIRTGSREGAEPSAGIPMGGGVPMPVVPGAASPSLAVNQTAFDFGKLRRGAAPARTFVIDNSGGGVLQGSIAVSHPEWMKVSQAQIDPRRHHQEVTVSVDTSSLPLGTSHVGMLEIRSNGGRHGIRVSCSIELEAAAVSRWRAWLFWTGLLAGGLFGYFLYTLSPAAPARDYVAFAAGLAGFVAFVAVGAVAGGWGGGIGMFLLATVAQTIQHASMTAASVLAWAMIFSAVLYFFARRLLVGHLAGDWTPRVWAAVTGIVLAAAIIVTGSLLAPGLTTHRNLRVVDLPVEDKLAGSTVGEPSGIQWVHALGDRGAMFSASDSSRIEYPGLIPLEGTLEFWIRVNSGYYYANGQFTPNQDSAMIFSSDVHGGDVAWPGATKLWVSRNGTLSFWMATMLGDNRTQPVEARATKFRFAEWHAVGVSYGGQGEYLMLDGKLVASAPKRTQTFGRAGNHQEPLDIPTIGETVSHFWPHHRYEGGFEGILAAFRVSAKQKDWQLAQGVQAGNPSGAAPGESPATDASLRQWTALKLGEKQGDFALDTDRRLYYQNVALDGFAIPAESDGAWVSPASPAGDVMCYSLGSQAQGILIHLPQHRGSVVLDGSKFAFGLSAVQWVSWSPDGAYALAAHYREAHSELFAISARDGDGRRLPISLAREHEEQAFDLDSVKWDSNEQFRMRATIHCNPFTSESGCSSEDHKAALRTYDLAIDARSLDVSATLQAGVAASVSPSFDCSKASTPTEKLICRDSDLASMERTMVSAYRQALDRAAAGQKAAITREHYQWFSQYARTCDAKPSDSERKVCVSTFLRDRTRALTSLAAQSTGPQAAARTACVYDPVSNVRQLKTSSSTIVCRIETARTIGITAGPFATSEGVWWVTDVCGRPGFIANNQIRLDARSCP